MCSKDANSSLKQLLADSIKASGFPFQAKVESLIDCCAGWEVLGSEWPWRHEGCEEFIDIVAKRDNKFVILECKKTGLVKEAKKLKKGLHWPEGAPNRSFVFLCRSNDRESSDQTTRTIVTYGREEDPDDAPDTEDGIQGEERDYMPKSFETSLCVTVGSDGQTLERDASLLARSCHAFAQQYFSNWYIDPSSEVFIPVFVTTAPLFVFHLNPTSVSVEDGIFDFTQEDIISVPYVRFTKAFMAESRQNRHDRTVFVVSSTHFEEFLRSFQELSSSEISRHD
jgi:hypothetical protein